LKLLRGLVLVAVGIVLGAIAVFAQSASSTLAPTVIPPGSSTVAGLPTLTSWSLLTATAGLVAFHIGLYTLVAEVALHHQFRLSGLPVVYDHRGHCYGGRVGSCLA